ncbi:MAG: hypothetical protein AB7E27_00680 [Candidatus Methanomethylophilaceae archaeon]
MLEIEGIPFPKRRRFIRMFRVDGAALAVIIAIAFVSIMDSNNWVYMIPFIGTISGMFLLFSEFFAHQERRDSSSMIIVDEKIVLKNDYIDHILRRPTEITFQGLKMAQLIFRPSDDGNEPYFLVMHTQDGKRIDSGAKEAEGLREAVALLQNAGIRVEDIK